MACSSDGAHHLSWCASRGERPVGTVGHGPQVVVTPWLCVIPTTSAGSRRPWAPTNQVVPSPRTTWHGSGHASAGTARPCPVALVRGHKYLRLLPTGRGTVTGASVIRMAGLPTSQRDGSVCIHLLVGQARTGHRPAALTMKGQRARVLVAPNLDACILMLSWTDMLPQ